MVVCHNDTGIIQSAVLEDKVNLTTFVSKDGIGRDGTVRDPDGNSSSESGDGAEVVGYVLPINLHHQSPELASSGAQTSPQCSFRAWNTHYVAVKLELGHKYRLHSRLAHLSIALRTPAPASTATCQMS